MGSVYQKRKDDDDDDDKKPKPNDIGKEIVKNLDNIGKGISEFFGGKDKKWAKKGTGHTLGDSSTSQQQPARSQPPPLLASSHNGAASAARQAPPQQAQQQQQSRAPNPQAAAAANAAAARAAAAARPASARTKMTVTSAQPKPTADTATGTATDVAAGRGAATVARAAPAQSESAHAFSEALQALCSMGFDATRAQAALQRTGGEIESALDLLSGDSELLEQIARLDAPVTNSTVSETNLETSLGSSIEHASESATEHAAGHAADLHAATLALSPPPPPPPLTPAIVHFPTDRDERVERARAAAAAAAANGEADLPAIQLLIKLVANVAANPTEPKYRRVRLTNQKLAAAFGGRPHALELLQLVGFRIGTQIGGGDGAGHGGDGAGADGDGAGVAGAGGGAGGGGDGGDGDSAVMSESDASDTDLLSAWASLLAEAEANAKDVALGPSNIKVMHAAENNAAPRTEDLPADFFSLTAEEARSLVAAAHARRAADSTLRTRETREAEAARRRRMYRKAMVRVRFPDGTMIQATFAVGAPISRVLTWVANSLREPNHPFELAVARGKPLDDPKMTVGQAELAPAALLNFHVPRNEVHNPPFLRADLLANIEQRTAEELPQGYGGAQPQVLAAKLPEQEKRVPKWAPK